MAEGTKWQLKHFEHIDSDPVCACPRLLSLSGCTTVCLMRLGLCVAADERLARLFKGNPPTEDAYVYLGNGPHEANGSAVGADSVAATTAAAAAA